MFERIGRQDPPPITHPLFYFGFAGVALAWQVAFIVIAKDPARYRLMMIPALLEKLSYIAAAVVLYLEHRITGSETTWAFPDTLLALLFVIAYFKTPSRTS